MEVREIELTAGTRVRVGTPGRFFILTRTPSAVDIEFTRNGTVFREKGANVLAGYTSRPSPVDPNAAEDIFDDLVFVSAVNQTIQYAVSMRDGEYAGIGIDVALQQPSTFVSTADASTASAAATSVLAANANRKSVSVRNISVSGLNLRIGDSAITTTRGLRVRPGETFTTLSTAEIFVIRETTDVTVSILEETI